MTVRLTIAPATPARTDATPSPSGQRREEGARREATVLALQKLRNQYEPARDQHEALSSAE